MSVPSSCLSVYFFILCIRSVRSTEVEVISSFGRIRGIKNSINGSVMYQFRNIPYALPPVGHLRFQKPVPHPSLRGVYDGTKFGPSCMQKLSERRKRLLENLNLSEDCLQLNIYVPNSITSIPRAVMIWIHGGSFIAGQGTSFDASSLASVGDVLVVTINYRLGLFGFLSTEDERYPGNYGLFDQLEAIKWTKRHIRSFGGDPKKITIFGESAGAFSIAYLATSPLSKNLFQRVIMESGGAFSRHGVYRRVKETTMLALNRMGCGENSSLTNDVQLCLRELDKHLILNVSEEIDLRSGFLISLFGDIIGPCVDGELIVGAPIDLLQNSSSDSAQMFGSLDVMAGINSADGGLFLDEIEFYQSQMKVNFSEGVSKDILCKIFVSSIVNIFFHSNINVTQAICEVYTKDEGLAQQGLSMIDFGTDITFGAPNKEILDFHLQRKSSHKNTYQYLFSSTSSFTWSTRPPWFQGANHADEIPYVFGLKHFVPNYTKAEESLSELMMTYWTNFAKTGNPNYGRTRNISFWPAYNYGNAYMEFNVDRTKSNHDLYRQRFTLWLETIPRIIANAGQSFQTFG